MQNKIKLSRRNNYYINSAFIKLIMLNKQYFPLTVSPVFWEFEDIVQLFTILKHEWLVSLIIKN